MAATAASAKTPPQLHLRFVGHDPDMKHRKTPLRLVAAAAMAATALLGTAVAVDALQHDPHSETASEAATHSHAPMEHGAHAGLLALVDVADATHVGVSSGDWNSPTTWAGGVVPTNASRVHIPAGISVTVDGQLTAEMKTVRVDGVLRFATDVDTELRVDTLVTTPSGTLEIGTAETPIQGDVTARIVFADDGPIDRSWDPTLLSRGALLAGSTSIQGTEVTHRTIVSAYPTAGATSIDLATPPVGWDVGDELVITGTSGPTSDERRTIASIEGTTVRFTDPLVADHVPPAEDLDLYVANLSRNVQFSSANTQIDRRGHLMVMHTLDAQIRGASFTDMGRTDKSQQLDDFEFAEIEPGAVGWDGTFEELGGTNVRGRYSVHVHRGGADPTTTAAVISDSVVTGDPGWAFTNHSSNVDFVRNVAYDNAGAGFFTEAGDEVGAWIDNIAIRTVMPNFEIDDEGAIDPDLRAERQDFGVDGDGFWLQGNRVDLIGNVAAGSSAHGIIWWSEALAEADLGKVSTVQVSTLPDPSLVPDREELAVWWAPLGEVRDNVSYGATVGFRARYIHGGTYLEDPDTPSAEYIDTLNPVIDGLTTWDVRDGVLMNYNERLSLRNIRAIGIAEPFRHNYGLTAAVGVGLDVGNENTFGPSEITGVRIEGFEVGIIGPRHGQWAVDDVDVAATTDVLLHAPESTERALDLSNLRFTPLEGTALEGRDDARRHIVLAYDYNGDGDGVDPSTATGPGDTDGEPLFADRVTWDGQGVYSVATAPDGSRADASLINGVLGEPAPIPTITHVPGASDSGDSDGFDDDDRDDAEDLDDSDTDDEEDDGSDADAEDLDDDSDTDDEEDDDEDSDDFDFDFDEEDELEDELVEALEEEFGEEFAGLTVYVDDEGYIDVELLWSSCGDDTDSKELARACDVVDAVISAH